MKFRSGLTAVLFLVCLLVCALSTCFAEETVLLNTAGQPIVALDSWDPTVLQKPEQSLVRTFKYKGKQVDEIVISGRPPKNFKAEAVAVPQTNAADGVVVLPNVPAFDWCYGCSATSAAMMMGYYDNNAFPDMYIGPVGGGICPLNNSVWGSGECPLSASHMGVDGRNVRGHVDDYWRAVESCATDPYVGYWTEHTDGACTADYMGTNQSRYSNCDGSTTFFLNTDGSPLYDYTGSEPGMRDGCHGLRLFAESRGYTVTANYTQYIYGYNGNQLGITFSGFQHEIDAGRPVLIQVTGHTMLGYGYNTAGQIIYVHDTWDHLDHQMTWGGSYSGLQHYAVTVLQMVNQKVSSVSFSIPGGVYQESASIAMSCSTQGAVIRYTTDGNDPTENSSVYSSPLPIQGNLHLKARGYKTGLSAGNIASADYGLDTGIGNSKNLADGSAVAFTGAVTAVFQGQPYFYVEAENRSSGIRVVKSGHGLSVGNKIDVIGSMQTDSYERYIRADSLLNVATGTPLTPIGMSNVAVGGGTTSETGQRGISGAEGPNNIGLLVRTWGMVTERQSPQIGNWNLNYSPGWYGQGQWAFGMPIGGGGVLRGNRDPSKAYTGSYVYGVNLYGDYNTSVGGPYYLTTKAIDCTGHSSVTLNFWRWLNSDYPPFVYATVQVAASASGPWTTVWQNDYQPVTDSVWTQCSYDISAVAANQPTVYVRWGYQVANYAFAYSGWNIDDIELVDKTQQAYCVLDDGSGVGVKALIPAKLAVPAFDSYVAITGISSIERYGSDLLRLILVRDQSDLP